MKGATCDGRNNPHPTFPQTTPTVPCAIHPNATNLPARNPLNETVGAVPMCPLVSPCKGAFVVHSPCTMRVFLVWKRRYADVRAGTQAPPLRLRLRRIACGKVSGVGDCAWDGWCRLGKCGVGVISSVARRALHICKWLRSILRAWGWNGFRAGRRPPSLCAPRISRLLFGSR